MPRAGDNAVFNLGRGRERKCLIRLLQAGLVTKRYMLAFFMSFGGFIFLLLCKLEPSIVIRSMKLAEQAWNS